MASGTVLQSTNNSTMTLRYSGTDGQDKVIEVPSTSGTMATESQVIGVGQTWQDVTASRVSNTLYTNNTGKPIVVSCVTPSGAIVNWLTVNGVNVTNSGGNNTVPYSSAIAIVPNEATYKFGTTSITITNWAELR